MSNGFVGGAMSRRPILWRVASDLCGLKVRGPTVLLRKQGLELLDLGIHLCHLIGIGALPYMSPCGLATLHVFLRVGTIPLDHGQRGTSGESSRSASTTCAASRTRWLQACSPHARACLRTTPNLSCTRRNRPARCCASASATTLKSVAHLNHSSARCLALRLPRTGWPPPPAGWLMQAMRQHALVGAGQSPIAASVS